jgi:pimeloyl-ACP methyl ester carboxylesterase
LKSCNSYRLSEDQIKKLKNIKFIFSEKDKLARFNPDNILIKMVKEDDITMLDDVGHFPYYENPNQLNEEFINIIKTI